jgi:hypothetical protein
MRSSLATVVWVVVGVVLASDRHYFSDLNTIKSLVSALLAILLWPLLLLGINLHVH